MKRCNLSLSTWKRWRVLALAWLSCCCLASAARAQAETSHPLEPTDTSSPRATLEGFLAATQEAYDTIRNNRWSRDVRPERRAIVERILSCLDLSEQPAYLREDTGKEAAVCLREVLDRIDLPPLDEIPDLAAIEIEYEPGTPAQWTIPHTDITIARVLGGPRGGEFLFSPDTVARATGFYNRVARIEYKNPDAATGFYEWFLSEPGSRTLSMLVHQLPSGLRTRWGGQAIWQWIGIGVTVVLGLFVMFLVYWHGRWLARRGLRSGIVRYWLTLAFPVSAMLVPLAMKSVFSEQLAISGTTLAVAKFACNVAFLFAAIVALVGLGNRIAEILILAPDVHPSGIDAQFIRLSCRVISLVGAAVVFLAGGQYLGIPLTTLLAGAGVGGLAVALAAQDTLKNVFGSMMIILDKPYRVGERIITKGYDGVVEEIGLRSTKIRLLNGHLASIPNEEMARSDIENVGRRRHIRRTADIPLPLDLSGEKARRAVDIVREILDHHEGSEPDFPPRVYMSEWKRDCLQLRLIYWYHPPDYWEFQAFSQRVNMQILESFESEGIKLALPSSTTFMASADERPLELRMVDEPNPPNGPPGETDLR